MCVGGGGGGGKVMGWGASYPVSYTEVPLKKKRWDKLKKKIFWNFVVCHAREGIGDLNNRESSEKTHLQNRIYEIMF